MKPIQFQASFDGVTTKKDGSIGVRITSQELSPEQKVQAMEYVNQMGWFMFSPVKFQDSDVPKEEGDFDKSKTPSKRLRAVLFILWQQSGSKGDFEIYYREQMEKVIEFIKEKLN